MNELECKLGLVEMTLEQRIYCEPTAYNLKNIPKIDQNIEMLEYVCEHDGLALKYASKKLITKGLCELAVKQNGMALEFVPTKILKSESSKNEDEEWYKKICEIAVESDGRAIKFVPEKYVDNDLVEKAIDYNKDKWSDNPPIYYVPDKFITEELIKKSVKNVPSSLKNIDENRITEEIVRIAVENNGLALKYVPNRYLKKKLTMIAIENNAMAIRYVPRRFINQEMCEKCFERDYGIISFIPEEYVTEKMCLDIISMRRFSVNELSRYVKEKMYNDPDVNIITFNEFPEKMRNNVKILDAIIEMYLRDSMPLLNWNMEVEKNIERYGEYEAERDYRYKVIYPLKEDTKKYLESRIKDSENTGISVLHKVINSGYMEMIEDEINEISLDTSIIEGRNELEPCRTKDSSLIHYLSGDDDCRRIYYISDIHLEHHLLRDKKLISSIINSRTYREKEEVLKKYIEGIIDEIIAGADNKQILLVGGDVSDSVQLSRIFYRSLSFKWMGSVISILGNHELWDGTTPKEWNDEEFESRSIEEIVSDYRKNISRGYPGLEWGVSFLENELYVSYKNKKKCIISEKMLLECTEKDLTELLEKSSVIILGGIGYSGLNPKYNSELGLYRKAITSIEEDRRRSDLFKRIYDKVWKSAADKKVIVLTHTPVSDWMSEKLHKNWIYVNGHTHNNSAMITKDGIVNLYDNQIGYGLRKKRNSNPPKYIYHKPKWRLKSFKIDRCWFDPFEKYNNGVYIITREEYQEFNEGRGILCMGCNYEGTIYMIKQGDIYMFLLKSAKSLCLLSGGKRKKLDYIDVDYYYNNLEVYAEYVKNLVEPYKRFIQRISNEVKRIGGDGTIHGCIVDIGFFSHIYVNPFDGKITPYWAWNVSSRKPYNSIRELIEKDEPQLLSRFDFEYKEKNIPIICECAKGKESKNELAVIPEWVFGTEMYEPSRIMNAVQYVWEKNVIRIWNDEILIKANSEGKKEIIKK